jgi:hypothetical protein
MRTPKETSEIKHANIVVEPYTYNRYVRLWHRGEPRVRWIDVLRAGLEALEKGKENNAVH